MDKLSGYVLSVIAAALILGILKGIIGSNGSAAALMRLVGGLFLAFVMIQPIAKFDFSAITAFIEDSSVEGELTAAQGERIADEEYRSIIKSNVEAYILDKAQTCGAQLSVEVTLSEEDDAVPEEVRLRGNVSPYAKSQLQTMMEEDLGIAKENQIWIG